MSVHPSRCLRAVACAAIVLGAAVPACAPASIFDPGENIGRFKVVGGHFRQHVNYLASYQTTGPDVQDECWTYHVHDKGAADFDLTFDKGEVSALKYDRGIVRFVSPLTFSGPVSRRFDETYDTSPGPKSYQDDCLPANYPKADTGGCGAKTLKSAASSLYLGVLGKGGVYRPNGEDAELSGVIFHDDPFEPCPSDSIYAIFPVGPAISAKSAKALDDAKIGTKVSLHGQGSASGPGPDGFNTPFTFEAGSQQATGEWSLTLVRVKAPKKP